MAICLLISFSSASLSPQTNFKEHTHLSKCTISKESTSTSTGKYVIHDVFHIYLCVCVPSRPLPCKIVPWHQAPGQPSLEEGSGNQVQSHWTTSLSQSCISLLLPLFVSRFSAFLPFFIMLLWSALPFGVRFSLSGFPLSMLLTNINQQIFLCTF